MSRDPWVSVIPRDVVERTAAIVGEASGAARALRQADEMGGPVIFLRPRGSDKLIVLRYDNAPAPTSSESKRVTMEDDNG